MSRVRTLPTGSAGKPPARNEPCPCGSGLKYKQCCAIRPRAATPSAPTSVALGTLTAHGREVSAEAAAGRVIRGEPRQPAPLVTATGRGTAAAQPVRRSPELVRCLGDARRLREAGRVLEAIPLLQQAARLDATDPRIRFDLGMALLGCGRPAEAVDSLAAATGLDPDDAVAYFHLGRALSRQGRVPLAIAAYRAAIALSPAHADAHLHLGELLQGQRQTEAAAEAFEKAAAALGGTTKGRLAEAKALVARDRPDEAMTLLRRARALDPKSTDVAALLANTLVGAGRFGDAEQELTLAIARDATHAVSLYGMAKVRKQTAADRPLLRQMAALLEGAGISEHDRMLLHFGLGKAHDDLREFEAAIGHFDAATRIRGAAAPLDRKTLVRFVDRDIEMFPRGASAFDATLGVDDARPIFVLGLPRSGTTLVEQILSSHPSVAAGGELSFWGEQGAPALAAATGSFTREALRELAGRYQAVLRGVSPDALRVTDKNPFNYLYIGLLRLVFPRAFIIHCRRHPVDTCLSMYTNYLSARALQFMGNREDLVFYHGEYSRLMRHWREVLPPGRFLEMDYEALVADREAETRRLVAFCELEWHDACLQPERNQRTINTASHWQARQPVYRSSLERWRNYQPWLGPLADLLAEPEPGG